MTTREVAPSARAATVLHWLCAGVLFGSLLALPAHADSLDTLQQALSNAETSPVPQGWTVGGIVVTNTSPYRASGKSILVFPGAIYLGERVTFTGDRASYTFAREGATSFYGRLRWRGGNLDPKDAPEWEGMFRREGQLEAGLGTMTITSAGLWTARFSSDVSGRSKGTEVLLNWSIPIVGERWLIMGGVDMVWRSRRFNNYFYGGVSPAEATTTRPAYDVGDSWSFAPSLVATYRLSPRWVVGAAISHENFSRTVRDGPLVQRRGRTDALIALGYTLR